VAQDQEGRGAEGTAPPAEKKGHAIVVERLTHQDVPAICALYKKVGDSWPPGLPAELLKAWQPAPLEFTSRMEGITYFAARRDGRMVGSVGCEVYHGSCNLIDLAVDPEVRRQGVGTALLTAALEWAKRGNVRSVWVETPMRFTGAGPILKRHGFVEAGALHRHDWGEDIQLFERVL
jgi:GNAT superfamily N-acetyltransferase